MHRIVGIVFFLTVASSVASKGWAQSAAAVPASTYEVQINGESFVVEANRVVKVESKEKPGVTYKVAVRVAPTQRIRLDNVEFEYELPAKVHEEGKRGSRSIRLAHELGFSILLSELGPAQEPEAQEETLKVLVKSVTDALREEKAEAIEVSEPHNRVFAESSARGITVRYRDAKDFDHLCLLYVLTGPNFTVSCVVEYLENDAEDVLPLVKKTLDSVRGNPERR